MFSRYQIEELLDVASREHLRLRIPHHEMEQPIRNINAVHVVLDEFPAVHISPDSKDNPILGAAIAGHADLIVSGDKRDMLALKTASGIPIVTPREAIVEIASH